MFFFRRTKPEQDDDGRPEFDGQCATCEHSEPEGDAFWCHFYLRRFSKADSQEGCRGYVEADPEPDDDPDADYPDYNEI